MSEEKVIQTKAEWDEAFWSTPYFAFLDILGFRELVKYNSHNDLVDLYKRLVNFPVEFYSEFHEKEEKSKKERFGENFEPTGLRIVNISDSIMIWTTNGKENTLIELVSAVKLLMSLSFSIGIPLRGSIVMGDIAVLEQKGYLSIVGKGLVHAYELEGKQQWSGCEVDNGIFRYLKSFQKQIMGNEMPLRIEKLDSLLVETDIPTKDGNKKGKAVNWAHNANITEDLIKESFGKYNKRKNESEQVKKSTEEKIENTLKFFRNHKAK